MAGAFDDFDPTGAKGPKPPVAAPKPGGAFSDFSPTATPSPAAPKPAGGAFGDFDPTGTGAQTTAAAAQPGWGVDWSKRGGEITMPQSVQDWGNIAGNEAGMGLVGLKAQADAARQRLGPMGAASADIAGNILSPTTLLNAVGGPVLAGAAHEGIKSAAAGNDLKTIAEDTAAGAGWGAAGWGAAKYAPKVLPRLTEEGVKTGAGYLTHQLFGGWANAALPEGLGTILPFMTGYGLTQKLGGLAGKGVEKIADLPATKQAIQNLILGSGSALRTAAGPWDQWIPGQ